MYLARQKRQTPWWWNRKVETYRNIHYKKRMLCLYTVVILIVQLLTVIKKVENICGTRLKLLLCSIIISFLYWYQLDTQFLYKLHKIKFLYMFRASSAYLQEVNDVKCTCMQPLVYSFSAGGRLVHLLRGVSP